MFSPVFISLVVIAALQQQGRITIVQKTSGLCSPTIANVDGNVKLTCRGVDARAVQRLNAELNRKNLELEAKIREADQWAARYKELEEHLSQATDDSALSRQAKEYLHTGELEKAGAVLDEILSVEEPTVEVDAANHYTRGQVFELQFRTLDALPHFEKAYRYRPQEIRYGLAYAFALLSTSDLKAAESVYMATLDRARELGKTDPSVSQPYVATVQNNLANLYSKTLRLKEAEAAYQESLDIDRQWGRANPGIYDPDTATTLNNLAVIYRRTGRMKEAEAAFHEALAIYQQLAKINPDSYRRPAARTMNNLAVLYRQTHRTKEAEVAFQEALEIHRQMAKVNPVYREDVGTTLNGLGHLYKQTQRTKEAEVNFREALEIFRQLAKTNPDAFQEYVATSLDNLAGLFAQTERMKEAEADFQQVLEIRRQLAKANPDAYQTDVAETLVNLAIIYEQTRRMKEAEAAYQEAAMTYRQLAKTDPNYKSFVAYIQERLAFFYAATLRKEQAEAAYVEILDTYRELAKTDPDAYQLPLSQTLHSLAAIHLQAGNLPQAAKESQESVTINRGRWRASSADAADDLARSLLFDMLFQKSSAACQLAREAAGVAQSSELKQRANEEMSKCPSK